MIKEKIYKYCTQNRREPREKKTFSPSSLSKCRRALYYTMTAQEPSNPIEDHTYIKFELGHSTHDWMQKILSQDDDINIIDMETLIEKNKFGLDWRYRLDCLCQIRDKKYIIEIKSTYMSGWNSVEKEPKPDHLLQLYAYMKLENIENGILLYIGRDNGYMVEYHVNINDDRLCQIFENKIEDLSLLLGLVNAKVKPLREYKIYIKNTGDKLSYDFTKDKVKYKSNWQCQYCDFKDECWKEEIKMMENSKFYIDGEFIPA